MRTSNHDKQTKSKFGIIFFAAALLLPSISLRFVQLYESNSALEIGDFRGISADILVICCILVLLVALSFIPSRPVKILSLIFVPIFWCALTYGNYEHIKALGAMSTWAYISFLLDPTFVNGSLLQASRPILLATLLTITFLLSVFALRHKIELKSSIAFVFMIHIPALIIFLLASDSLIAEWRKNNHFIHNISWAKTNIKVDARPHEIKGLYPGDIGGEARIALNNKNQNVLLLVLEGVSGAYLDRVAKKHGIKEPGANLSSLDVAGDSGLVYLNFVNHQRQTNRGLYSLICGDLPRQRTSMPKMSELGAYAKPRNCLPNVLKNHGYRTSYIQSAPLAFMGKDKFMPVAGFDETYGTEWLAENGAITGKWGVDDNVLLNKVSEFIDNQLETDSRPWFLTVLSAGTHHPFIVPKSFESSETKGSFAHAIAYLNVAFEGFIERLNNSGILNNTLVVITSDESFGRHEVRDLNELLRSQAFGTLTVLAPNIKHQTVKEPFMQMDIPISITDYLGLDNEEQLGGRSVFRLYDKNRVLPFANTYLRTSAMFDEDGSLTTCEENLINCRSFQLKDDMLMSAKMSEIDVEAKSIQKLRNIAERSYYTGITDTSKNWQLIETGKPLNLKSFDIDPETTKVKVFGSQYFSVDENSTIRVSIEFFAKGDDMDLEITQRLTAVPTSELPDGIEYSYQMASERKLSEVGINGQSSLGMRPEYPRKRLFKQKWVSNSPNSYVIEYVYKTGESLDLMNCSLYLKNLSTNDVELLFKNATMVIEPGKAESKEGLTVLELTES